MQVDHPVGAGLLPHASRVIVAVAHVDPASAVLDVIGDAQTEHLTGP